MIININISKIWVNRQLTCEKLDRITGELTISKINRINWINIGNVKNFLSHFRHETNLKTSHSLLSHQNILLRFLSYSVAYEYIIMLVSLAAALCRHIEFFTKIHQAVMEHWLTKEGTKNIILRAFG